MYTSPGGASRTQNHLRQIGGIRSEQTTKAASSSEGRPLHICRGLGSSCSSRPHALLSLGTAAAAACSRENTGSSTPQAHHHQFGHSLLGPGQMLVLLG